MRDFWSKFVAEFSDTFPFNYLVDAICVILILWWMIRDHHNDKRHE